MPFGRSGKGNSSRSQNPLPEPPTAVGASGPAGAANPPPSASSSAFSSGDFFDTRSGGPGQQHPQQQQNQQQSPHQAPPHLYGTSSSSAGSLQQQQQQQQPPQPLPSQQQQRQQNQPAASSPAFDSRHQQQQQKSHDYAEAVARSQSQRYPHVSPVQTSQQYGIASSSADDLIATNIASPGQPQFQAHVQQPPQQQQQQQQHPQQQAAPQPEKRSARKLVKALFQTGSSSSRSSEQQQQQYIPQNSYDNTSGLARRPSTRVSNNPPGIRTGISQVSLQEHPEEWQGQVPLTQPSPVQGVGQFEPYADPSTRESQLHDLSNIRRGSIRHVGPDVNASYEDLAFQLHRQQQQQQQQPPGQAISVDPPQYAQVNFDPSPQHRQHPPPGEQQYQYPSPQHGHHQPFHIGHLQTNPQLHNIETISQFSHESPTIDSDQRSENQQTTTSPAVAGSNNHPLSQAQDLQQQQQQQSMAPPPGPGSQRRPNDPEKQHRGGGGGVEPPQGPPPGYRNSQLQPGSAAMNNPLPPPPPGQGVPGGVGNPGVYRQNTSGDQRSQFDAQGADQGRNSPQPPSGGDRGADTESEKAFKDLLTKYKNVKRLYFENKNQIELLNNQVEQLQNAVANQRMSQSRTSLDDNEYTTRFNRLGGAINNLAFNIRKDWQTIPAWLEGYVTPDALKTGKQEMTAAGRAIVTKWLVDEIFSRCFHPGLDQGLSRSLKEIEQNIRRFSYKMNSAEEFEALTSKVVSWRMATLEGLSRVLQSPEAAENRADFTRRATTNLTAFLFQHLCDPAPAGVEGSASMIVELAVGIAMNLPLESRDVCIIYPLPGDPVRPEIMDVEKAGLPPLPSVPTGGANKGDDDDEDEDDDESDDDGASAKEDAKGSVKGGGGGPNAGKDGGSARVRLAGFVAVEVRGRQVLVRAPVWTL